MLLAEVFLDCEALARTPGLQHPNEAAPPLDLARQRSLAITRSKLAATSATNPLARTRAR
jgi:hypothetical protein